MFGQPRYLIPTFDDTSRDDLDGNTLGPALGTGMGKHSHRDSHRERPPSATRHLPHARQTTHLRVQKKTKTRKASGYRVRSRIESEGSGGGPPNGIESGGQTTEHGRKCRSAKAIIYNILREKTAYWRQKKYERDQLPQP